MKKIILLLVAFSIISLPLYLVRFNIAGMPTTFHEIIVWVTFIILLFSNNFKNNFKKVDKLIWRGILLIVIGSLVGLYISSDKIATAGLIKGFIITPIVLGLSIFISGCENKIIIKSLLISGLIVAVSVYFDLFTQNISWDGRTIGIYNLDNGASPNYVSLYLAPIASLILVSTIFSLAKKAWHKTLFKLLVFILLFGAIIASGSRAGIFIVLLISFIVIYSILIRKTEYKMAINYTAVILVAVLTIAVVKIASPDLSATPNSGRISSSNNIRYEIWKTTIRDIIPQYWFTGVGIGQYQAVFTKLTESRVNYPEYISPKALTPHNVFLSAWINLGLVGLIGLIIIIISVYRNWYLSSRGFNGIHNTYFILLTTIILLGMVDTTIFKNDLGGLFWIAIFMINSEKSKLS